MVIDRRLVGVWKARTAWTLCSGVGITTTKNTAYRMGADLLNRDTGSASSWMLEDCH